MKLLVLPVMIACISGVFLWWLNQDRYDVRYTLSENIPLSFGGGPQEAVQQLVVKNLSKKEVTKVQVKLPLRVIQFELFKNSQADTTNTFTKQDSFELLYDALPPQGSFRLVLKTTGAGISKQEVQVRHSRGSAEEALAATSLWESISTWLTTGVLFLYCWLSLIQLRNWLVETWKSYAEDRSEQVLRASKPIYIPRDKWKEIRDKAITKFGELDNYHYYYGSLRPSDIVDSPIYRYLDSEKPEHLSEEEWQQFRSIKTQQLLSALNARIMGSWLVVSADELLRLLKVKKPIQLPSDKWEQWQDGLQKLFIARALSEEPSNTNVDAKMQQSKPDEIGVCSGYV
jgi:hypothetical protein